MALNMTLLQKMCKMGWNYFKFSTTLHIVGFQESGVVLTFFWLRKSSLYRRYLKYKYELRRETYLAFTFSFDVKLNQSSS